MPCNDLMDINATTISTFFHKQKNAQSPTNQQLTPYHQTMLTNIIIINQKKILIFANEKTKNINLLNILT